MGREVKKAYSRQQVPFFPCFLTNFKGNGLCATPVRGLSTRLTASGKELREKIKNISQIKVVNLSTIIPTIRASSDSVSSTVPGTWPVISVLPQQQHLGYT